MNIDAIGAKWKQQCGVCLVVISLMNELCAKKEEVQGLFSDGLVIEEILPPEIRNAHNRLEF